MKKKDQTIPEVKPTEKKWLNIKLKKLEDNEFLRLLNNYTILYEEPEHHIKSLSELNRKYKLLWFIDIDNNITPDSYILYKVTKAGNKLILCGSKGNKESEKALIDKIVDLLKLVGWYSEIANELEKILRKQKTPIVINELLAMKVLNKPIEWLGDGRYLSNIIGIGSIITTMFGKPKVSK